MQFIITAKAKSHIRRIIHWYEKERVGLGATFVERLTEAFDEIQSAPLRRAVIFRDVRIAMTVRFPYIILYRVKPDAVRILAVIHSSRDSGDWESFSE